MSPPGSTRQVHSSQACQPKRLSKATGSGGDPGRTASLYPILGKTRPCGSPLLAVNCPLMPHHLAGVREIATLLGVSRQRADQWTRTKGFPDPVVELASGRIWATETIMEWA